ncbi:hypothetical protein ACQP3L_35960, partial [Escherichia coli]
VLLTNLWRGIGIPYSSQDLKKKHCSLTSKLEIVGGASVTAFVWPAFTLSASESFCGGGNIVRMYPSIFPPS